MLSRLRKRLPSFGRLNAWPASLIDQEYLKEPMTWYGKLWSFAKIRLTYVALFYPLTVIDLLCNGAAGFRYALGSFFTADEYQEKRLKELKKYATYFGRCLSALFAIPLGIISPKLIAFYFTPEKEEGKVESGAGFYQAENVELRTPEEPEEVTQLVREAIAKGYKVMPVGAGRSQGKQFIPEGGRGAMVIDLAKLNTVQINAREKTAIVGAGARWKDIQVLANPHKLALKVMQASNVFSVGGSIGTNIHGWDHRNGTLSNTILEMTIVNAQGEEQTITRSDPLFHQITGGLGLFGIVTSVKIQLTDNERLKEVGTPVAIKDYVEHFRNNVETDDNIRMHLFRLSLDPNNLLLGDQANPAGIAVDYVKVPGSRPCVTPNLTFEESRGSRIHQVAINLMRRIGWLRKKYWDMESSRLVANNTPAQTTNEIMQPPINAMFNPSVSEGEWLQEYFLPGENLEGFLRSLSQLLKDNQVPLVNASVRYVKQNADAALSYVKGGDRFAVVLCFNQSYKKSEIIKAQKWLRQSQQLALNEGGTFYTPYQQVTSPDQFRAAYPNVDEVRSLKLAADPNEVFTSGFYQKYMTPPDTKPNYFKIVMQDAAAKKEFEGFLTNVLQRVDVAALYDVLEDILKYKDSHEEIYAELCARLPLVMPSTINDLRHILNSLSSIKKDLGEQAAELLEGTHTINGLVEIGYPGRFVGGFKQRFNVTGKVVAVYEKQSLSDYVQTGIPRPYDQFEALNYDAPDLHNLADNSADVITCYVGLHHITDDKLDAFLADVRRVLRPGGRFLLVDHDVTTDKSLAMAHMAHMIFNAVNGVSLEEEMKEVRNFRPMSYWTACLARHDLAYSVQDPDVPLVRAGDPSRNRMVSFTKQAPRPVVIEEVAPVVVEAQSPARLEEPTPASPLTAEEVVAPRPKKKLSEILASYEARVERNAARLGRHSVFYRPEDTDQAEAAPRARVRFL